MFTRVDGVVLAVPDASAAAHGWEQLLGARHHGDERVDVLGARRSRYRLGDGWVDFLEPDGAGPVAEALSVRGGGHLFAGRVATPDVAALAAHLKDHGVDPPAEGSTLFLDPAHTGGRGLRLEVGPEEARERVGRLDSFYEITNLVHDAPASMTHYADLFGLDASSFCPISSDEYGYEGTLTLFDPERLDRLEVITPVVPDNTMGRFFSKHGETLYMCFAEAGMLPEIEAAAIDGRFGHTRVPPRRDDRDREADTVFLHPSALGGMMLGLSRRTVAWVWSGRPDRVEAVRS